MSKLCFMKLLDIQDDWKHVLDKGNDFLVVCQPFICPISQGILKYFHTYHKMDKFERSPMNASKTIFMYYGVLYVGYTYVMVYKKGFCM